MSGKHLIKFMIHSDDSQAFLLRSYTEDSLVKSHTMKPCGTHRRWAAEINKQINPAASMHCEAIVVESDLTILKNWAHCFKDDHDDCLKGRKLFGR